LLPLFCNLLPLSIFPDLFLELFRKACFPFVFLFGFCSISLSLGLKMCLLKQTELDEVEQTRSSSNARFSISVASEPGTSGGGDTLFVIHSWQNVTSFMRK
jgi:hypothetical protein